MSRLHRGQRIIWLASRLVPRLAPRLVPRLLTNVLTHVLPSLLLCLGLAFAGAAMAHKASDSYLSLQVNGASIDGQWDIALRDLDFAIGLDGNDDGDITWAELRAKHADIVAYASSRLKLEADGAACTIGAGQQLVDNHTDGAYSVLRFMATCPRAPARLKVDYRLFADLDPQHRGLLKLQAEGLARSAVLGPAAASQEFELKQLSWFAQFVAYAGEGVWHIWIGFDHILFLLSLLLPAVLLWQQGRWQAADRFGQAFWEVAKVVTAFTLAHSITLTLASLGIVSLPSRWVESAIALSVLLAALNNLRPLFLGRRWTVAFGFGLIHGFGFASVLTELGLPKDTLALALVGFNLGVEGGQLAIVAAFLPLAYGLRRGWIYQRLILRGGSMLIAMISAVWLVERVFDLKLMPI